MREKLGLAAVPAGVAPDGSEAIICDIRANGASGYGHVMCGNDEAAVAVKIGTGFIPDWTQATERGGVIAGSCPGNRARSPVPAEVMEFQLRQPE